MRVLSILVVVLAVLLGLLYYRKNETLLGSLWQYCPSWLLHPVIFSGHLLGLHSKINASRIIYSHHGMKPNKDDLQQVEIEDVHLSRIAARVYHPRSLETSKNAPAVLYMSGSRFIYGGPESHSGFCYRLARTAGVIVFLINFKKAPEYIFPTSVNDCYEASIFLVNNADKFNVNPAKIILMGDGSGGNFAAAVSQQLADMKRGCVQFSFAAQVLIYPTLQFFDFTLPSYQKDDGGRSVSKETMALSWSYYLNGSDELTSLFLSGHHSRHLRGTKYQRYLQLVDDPQYSPDVDSQYLPNVDPTGVPDAVRKALTDPRACPLLADDLRQNPQTLIITADNDVLRDDSIIYAVRLKEAHVKVTHNSYPCRHDFLYYDYDSSYCPGDARQAFHDIVSFMHDVLKDNSDMQ